MSKRKRILLTMFLTIIVLGLMTSAGIFMSSVPILVLSTLLLVSLPFTAYQLVKNSTQV